MRYSFQYKSEEERDLIIQSHDDKHLIEEKNISEGNFLVFSDMTLEEEELIKNNAVEKMASLERETELLKHQALGHQLAINQLLGV